MVGKDGVHLGVSGDIDEQVCSVNAKQGSGHITWTSGSLVTIPLLLFNLCLMLILGATEDS